MYWESSFEMGSFGINVKRVLERKRRKRERQGNFNKIKEGGVVDVCERKRESG